MSETTLAAAVEALTALTESVARQSGWMPDRELVDAYRENRSADQANQPRPHRLTVQQQRIAENLLAEHRARVEAAWHQAREQVLAEEYRDRAETARHLLQQERDQAEAARRLEEVHGRPTDGYRDRLAALDEALALRPDDLADQVRQVELAARGLSNPDLARAYGPVGRVAPQIWSLHQGPAGQVAAAKLRDRGVEVPEGSAE